MTHRILGWFLGILYVQARGRETERFVNLCRNHRIVLWGLSVEEDREGISFYILLKDFYRLRKIVRKSKVFPVVKRRIGFPFVLDHMKKNSSFFLGILCMFGILLFLSGRIWEIKVSGQSYHTQESILKYLDQKGIYGGMSKKSLSCIRLREMLRKKYRDIGWISVEEKGCLVHIRIKEVRLIEKEKKKKPGHLVADSAGTVVSIVTRKGTAKVKAGQKVKKGDILISGVVKVTGDGDTLVDTDYVYADGDVILQEKKSYKSVLKKKYQKKQMTGRERKVYEWELFGKKFFLYNPLNNLESYEKYDIIRKGGILYPEISRRFPAACYVKVFKEVKDVPALYTKEEAEKILRERYRDDRNRWKEEGYEPVRASVFFRNTEDSYQYEGNLYFNKKQEQHRFIQKRKKVNR